MSERSRKFESHRLQGTHQQMNERVSKAFKSTNKTHAQGFHSDSGTQAEAKTKIIHTDFDN